MEGGEGDISKKNKMEGGEGDISKKNKILSCQVHFRTIILIFFFSFSIYYVIYDPVPKV